MRRIITAAAVLARAAPAAAQQHEGHHAGSGHHAPGGEFPAGLGVPGGSRRPEARGVRFMDMGRGFRQERARKRTEDSALMVGRIRTAPSAE